MHANLAPGVTEWALRSDLIGPPGGPARCPGCGRLTLLPWEGVVEAPWGERRELALCLHCAPLDGERCVFLPAEPAELEALAPAA
jgi:hypothetical protein